MSERTVKVKEKSSSGADKDSKLQPTDAKAVAVKAEDEFDEVTPSDMKEEIAEMKLSRDLFDVRVAVVGNVDSGKSTLIGVLTGGELDNGRGLARSRVFVHAHELANGRTSCISQHIMGFDKEGKPVHQTVPASAAAAAKTKSWRDVVAKSRSVLTFIDLAGHERYLKTTIAGLTGCFPDYSLVIINSLAGITKMTKEHLGVSIALEIPLVIVVTKVDMVPENVFKQTMVHLFKILKSPAAGKLPIQVRSTKDVDTVLENESTRVAPVFCVSSVTGTNIPLLTEYLSRLQPRRVWEQRLEQPVEFNIDETFNVTGVGVVFSGTVSSGVLTNNSTLLLGPMPDGSFKEVMVRSIQTKRVPVEQCKAGDSCAISVRPTKRKGEPIKRTAIRRGMVLVDPKLDPKPTRLFEAEVLVLHHPTTIKLKYQAVIHCGIIRQTAAIEHIDRECLRTGDKALVRFRFIQRPEMLHDGSTFIFREGTTKGIGKIVRVLPDADPSPASDMKEGSETSITLIPKAPAAAAGAVSGPAAATTTTAGGLVGDEKSASTPAKGPKPGTTERSAGASVASGAAASGGERVGGGRWRGKRTTTTTTTTTTTGTGST